MFSDGARLDPWRGRGPAVGSLIWLPGDEGGEGDGGDPGDHGGVVKVVIVVRVMVLIVILGMRLFMVMVNKVMMMIVILGMMVVHGSAEETSYHRHVLDLKVNF